MTGVSPEDQEMLDALQHAVNEALERKRRLGHYAVIWRDDRPVITGGEATDRPLLKPAHSDLAADDGGLRSALHD